MTNLAQRRSAAHTLALALRGLNDAAALTESPVDVIETVAESARALTSTLLAARREFPSLPSIDDLEQGIRSYNPISGAASPIGFAIVVDPPVAGDPTTIGRVTLGPNHEGHVGIAHGGVLALLTDEIVGIAATRKFWPAVTLSLSVSYRKPVPVGQPLILRSRVNDDSGPQMTGTAEFVTEADPSTVLATGEVHLLCLSAEQSARLLGTDIQRVNSG